MLKNCIKNNLRKFNFSLTELSSISSITSTKLISKININSFRNKFSNLNINFFKFSSQNFSTSQNHSEVPTDKEHVESMFISDDMPLNEILPINQKIRNLIAENDEYLEYNRILNMVKTLSSDFDLDKFKAIITYINDNQVTDVFLFKQFESLFVTNLDCIDYITKSTCVLMLGDYVNKKKTSFGEDNWLRILKDFQGLVEHMAFAEYYNYIVTFDRLFSRRKVQELGGKYTREFDNFISFQNIALFNSGKIEIKKLEDIFLFSKLTHNGVLKMSSIGDNIWLSINKIVETYGNEMNIYELLIITSLFINYHEVSGKGNYILTDAIGEVNKYIYSLMSNFEMLDFSEQENIINYADNIFNYYSLFMFMKKSKEGREKPNGESSLLTGLIKIYTEKLKSKNHDFMIFKEFRILQLLAKEVKYRDKEFWTLIAEKTMEYINKDFMKILNDIFPKRLLKNSTMTDDDKTRFQEKCDLQVLLYIGMIVETFTSADYLDKDFWEVIFQKTDHFANFKSRDIFVILNFITLGCKKMYKKENFNEVWEMFINLLDPKVKPIFTNREVVDFLVKMNSNYNPYNEKPSASSKEGIKVDELNKCLNALFMNNQGVTNDVNCIKLFSSFFSLVENKIKNDEKVIKILSNTLVDLVKLCEDHKQSDFELKFFQAKLRPSMADKVAELIKDRLITLFKECEMIEESDKKSYFYLVRKMINADFIDNLDIIRMKFSIERDGKLTEDRSILFKRLLKEN